MSTSTPAGADSSRSCIGSCHRPITSTVSGCSHASTESGWRRLCSVLVLVEGTDVLFAVDSVPAVLAVSREQFIVFSSNAFAILGLRAMYFLLADLHERFSYLQQGLAIILAFVGVKMLIADVYHLPTWVSLTVIAAVMTVAIAVSILVDRRDADEPHAAEEREREESRLAP